MSTPLTDSINALTTYANEVTGASDTTLSDAVYTLAQGFGGGGAEVATGTFAGDGTSNATIEIGFEPDIILVDGGVDFSQSGWYGVGIICLVKGLFAVDFVHTNTSATSATPYFTNIKSTEDEWGANGSAYRPYATYSNGSMTITNKTTNRDQTILINGQTYTWTAIKYS